MKLIDRIRKTDRFQFPYHITPSFEEKWAAQAVHIKKILDNPELPVLLIDNVADYYYHGTDQENWDLRRDFPNLAPPFPAFWIEHKVVTHIRSEKHGDTDLSHVGLKDAVTGFLFRAMEPEDVDFDAEVGPIPEGTRWIYSIEMFNYWGSQHNSHVVGPTGTFYLCVGEQGAALDRPHMQAYTSAAALDREPVLREVLRSAMQWAHPSLLAISFLHCRNVQMVENTTPPKLLKRTFERYGVRPAPWKTLVIEPLKQILQHEGRSGEVGLARALHICRGHFKDYREGRGLFGKYHQLVWHPSTVRGTRGDKPAPREIEVKLG